MEMPKNKIVIAVAAALGIGAVVYIAHAHASVNNAQAAADPLQGATGGSLPTLLYASGGGSATQLPVTGSTSVAPDPTATPAPTTSDHAIAAALEGTLNANATSLFATLPDTLAKNGLDEFIASQSQDAAGNTVLHTSVTYHTQPTNYTDVAVAPVAAPFNDVLQVMAQKILNVFPTWQGTNSNDSRGIVESFTQTAPRILGDSNLQQQWGYDAHGIALLQNLLPQAQQALAEAPKK